MKNFYCNNCNQDVELEDGKCPICKNNWGKVIDNAMNPKVVNGEENSIEEDITETISFYIRIAKIGKDIFAILAALLLALSIFYVALVIYEGQLVFMIISLIISGIMIFSGFLFEKNMRWKAYMLQASLKISKNKQ